MTRFHIVLLALFCMAAPAFSEPPGLAGISRIINGVDGSRVRLLVDLDEPLPEGSAFVLLCLHNAPANSGDRGFSVGSRADPVRLASPGKTECRSVAPARQRITLWVSGADRKLRPTMSLQLDLRSFASRVLRLEWLN